MLQLYVTNLWKSSSFFRSPIFILIAFFFLLPSKIFAAPVADFSVSSSLPCVNQSIVFSNLSTGNITSYSWDFGSGASIPTANTSGPLSVFYSTSGLKTISLTVSGPDGSNTITKSNYVNVSSGVPSISGIINGSTSVCANATNIFYSISPVANAASYNWTLPSGATVTTGQGSNSINSTFGTSGGNVCVTSSNGCGTSAALCKAVTVGKEQITLLTYNLLNYPEQSNLTPDTTLRHPFYRTIVSYVDPDIMVTQENTAQNGVNFFLANVLNANSNTYSAGTFINGYDSDNAIFYKTAKFSFVSNTRIFTDLRDINEFKLVHLLSGDTLRIYSVHLKASSTAPDEAQRALEVDSLRKFTNALPTGTNFLICGDFNIYKSTESCYQKLLAVTPGVDGHFIDPISMTGTWNSTAYTNFHTQSSRTRAFGGGSTGGVDDRFDLILFSNAMMQTGGISFVPGSTIPLGNDGNHYKDSINKQPNTAVPAYVADAVHYASDHLPVSCKIEFQNASCPNADLGVASLTTPSANTCSSPSQAVQIQVKNYGTNVVNFAFNNLQVNLKVTGPGSIIQNLSTIVTSGTINPGSTSTISLSGTINLSNSGNYYFDSKTIFSGDTIPANDSMPTATVVVYPNTPATISAGGPTTFCSGGSVMLTAAQSGTVTYQWKKNGSDIVNANAQSLNVNQSGSYQVLIQKTNTISTTYPTATFSNLNSYSIPNNSCTGALSTIAIAGFNGNIASNGISVKINITHTAVGDLAIYLQSPSGEILGLSNRTGNNSNTGDHFINTIFSDLGSTIIPTSGAPYTGTYKPWNVVFTSCITSTKTTFASLGSGSFNPNGNWKLLVYDRANSNTGSITNWSITFPSYSVNSTLVCDPVLSASTTVIVNPLPTITFSPTNPVICSNAGVTLTASGASTYSWSPSLGLNTTTGSIVIANPTLGTTYTVVGTDANSCSSTGSVNVSINTPPTVTLNNFSNVCITTNSFTLSGGSPSGGIYSGTGVNNGIFSPSTAGIGTHTISYTYVDGNGCSTVASKTIVVTGFPAAVISPSGPISVCSGSSIKLSTNSGYNYLWSNGATSQSILTNVAGNYTVTVSDNSGCTATSSAVVVSNNAQIFISPLFTESMGSPTATTLIPAYETANGFDNINYLMYGSGDVRTSSASSGYTGATGGGNVFITNTLGKNFVISGINTSGLTGMVLSFGVFKSTTASNGSELLVQYSTDSLNYTTLPFTLLPTGSGTAIWFLRSVTGIPAVNKLFIQFIQNGITPQFRIDDVSLTYENPNPIITFSGSSTICQGASTILTANRAATYLWDNGTISQTLLVNSTSSHFCSLTSSVGCSAVTNTVTITSVPAVFSLNGGGSYCSGSTAPLVGLSGSESGVTYQLKINTSNSGTPLAGNGSPISFGNQSNAGTYTVVATHSASGCTATMNGSSIILVNPLPTIFNVTGGGVSCSSGSGVSVGLSSSQTNVNYQLRLNNSPIGNSVSGTGSALNFGLQTASGTYSVIATNVTTSCSASMANPVSITSASSPTVYQLSGGGAVCLGGVGMPINLSGSQTGSTYLLFNSSGSTGVNISGTGNPLAFGNFTSFSSYYVVATNTSGGCTATMNNTVVISHAATPVIYNVTGGGSFCSVPNDGVAIGLSNSENGVVYTLLRNSISTGQTLSGNGSLISFGNQTTSGNYTVVATNTSSSCTSSMNGAAIVVKNIVSTWYIDADQDGYGNPSIYLLECDQPSGYIADNTDCNDANAAVNPGAVEICGNNIDDNCNGLIDEDCDVVLTLKINIEGLYLGSGNNVGVLSPLSCDTITVSLASSSAPYSLVFSSKEILSTSGFLTVSIPATFLNGNYFIVVNHRNALETWSTNSLLLNQPAMTYDFTLLANVFGNNLHLNTDGSYSVVSGDVNKNGVVDFNDFLLVENASLISGVGYSVFDLDGNLLVESSDYSLVENNIGKIVMRP